MGHVSTAAAGHGSQPVWDWDIARMTAAAGLGPGYGSQPVGDIFTVAAGHGSRPEYTRDEAT